VPRASRLHVGLACIAAGIVAIVSSTETAGASHVEPVVVQDSPALCEGGTRVPGADLEIGPMPGGSITIPSLQLDGESGEISALTFAVNAGQAVAQIVVSGRNRANVYTYVPALQGGELDTVASPQRQSGRIAEIAHLDICPGTVTPTTSTTTTTVAPTTTTSDRPTTTTDRATTTSHGSITTSDATATTSPGSTRTSDELATRSAGAAPASGGSTTASDRTTSDRSTTTSNGTTTTSDRSTTPGGAGTDPSVPPSGAGGRSRAEDASREFALVGAAVPAAGEPPRGRDDSTHALVGIGLIVAGVLLGASALSRLPRSLRHARRHRPGGADWA
jgi:hypothetical protein